MKPTKSVRKSPAASLAPPLRPGDGARHDARPRRVAVVAPAATPGERVLPDRVEIASMDSFPCSDPPAYNTSRA